MSEEGIYLYIFTLINSTLIYSNYLANYILHNPGKNFCKQLFIIFFHFPIFIIYIFENIFSGTALYKWIIYLIELSSIEQIFGLCQIPDPKS